MEKGPASGLHWRVGLRGNQRERAPESRVALYSVSPARRRQRGGRLRRSFWLPLIGAAVGLGWWGYHHTITSSARTTTQPPVAVALIHPTPARPAAEKVSARRWLQLPSPSAIPTLTPYSGAIFSRPSPASQQVPLVAPRSRSIRAPTAGEAGIPKHAHLLTGQGTGPGWCLANGGYPLGASYDGVYACGPSLGSAQPFDTDGFQCVELSERFLWSVYGKIIRKVYNGANLVQTASTRLHIPIGLPGPGNVPAPGDIISLWGWTSDPDGHTGVVTAVNVNRWGNGTIEMMEENGSLSGWDHIDVHHWRETFGDPLYYGGYFHYDSVSWLKLARHTSQPRTAAGFPRPSYNVSPLGPSVSEANSITDGGLISAMLDQHDKHHAPLHTAAVFQQGREYLLTPPEGDKSLTTGPAIADSEAMAAWAIHKGGAVLPYAVSLAGRQSWERLPGPRPEQVHGQALGLNANGTIAGWISTVRNTHRAVLWSPDGHGYRLHELSTNAGYVQPMAVAVDQWGDAVGNELLGNRRTAVTLWTPDGVPHRLPSRLRFAQIDVANALSSHVEGPNRILEIAGTSGAWNGRSQAVVWKVRVGGTSVRIFRPFVIPNLAGYDRDSAMAINQAGWVVGTASSLGRNSHAFLWRPSIGTVDLNTLLPPNSSWTVTSAQSINASGAITGIGFRAGSAPGSRFQGLVLRPEGN